MLRYVLHTFSGLPVHQFLWLDKKNQFIAMIVYESSFFRLRLLGWEFYFFWNSNQAFSLGFWLCAWHFQFILYISLGYLLSGPQRAGTTQQKQEVPCTQLKYWLEQKRGLPTLLGSSICPACLSDWMSDRLRRARVLRATLECLCCLEEEREKDREGDALISNAPVGSGAAGLAKHTGGKRKTGSRKYTLAMEI